MMLMLTTEDFRQLSPGCQAELLALLKGNEGSLGSWEDRGEPSVAGFYLEQPHQPNASDALGTKRVIDIDVDKARQLVANISEKSLDSLKLFATGDPVPLSALLGDDSPYQDTAELKRSFIGAVNRRLRTVTGNRQAVLFGADLSQKRIHVRPRTAASLRQAMNLSEPLPKFMVYGADGRELRDGEVIENARRLLRNAWQSFGGRPTAKRTAVTQLDALRHLSSCGFNPFLGQLQGWDEDSVCETYLIDASRHVDASVVDQMDHHGEVDLDKDDDSDSFRLFLSHPELGGMFVLLEDE